MKSLDVARSQKHSPHQTTAHAWSSPDCHQPCAEFRDAGFHVLRPSEAIPAIPPDGYLSYHLFIFKSVKGGLQNCIHRVRVSQNQVFVQHSKNGIQMHKIALFWKVYLINALH